MKAPICGVCLKSGILCRMCKGRLERGEISETDVELSRKLLVLSGRLRQLKEITVKKVLDSPGFIMIVCEPGQASLMVGRSGSVVKKLEKELGKPVRIVEDVRDISGFIKGLLKPTPVRAINTLYRDGKEILRVIVGKRPALRYPKRDYENIIRIMHGRDAEIGGA
jgi:transcription antitermination factor NusA-like protein